MTSLPRIIKGHVNEALNINDELFNERYTICEECPEMQNSKIGEICGVCGCRLQAKLRLAEERCPLQKWDKIT